MQERAVCIRWVLTTHTECYHWVLTNHTECSRLRRASPIICYCIEGPHCPENIGQRVPLCSLTLLHMTGLTKCNLIVHSQSRWLGRTQKRLRVVTGVPVYPWKSNDISTATLTISFATKGRPTAWTINIPWHHGLFIGAVASLSLQQLTADWVGLYTKFFFLHRNKL